MSPVDLSSLRGKSYQRLKLIYQKPEIKASLEVILSVFTVAFLLAIAIRPTLSTVAGLKKKIEDKEVVNKKLTNKIDQLVKADEQLKEHELDLLMYKEATPDNYDFGGLAKRVEIIAEENGVKIESLMFSRVAIVGEVILSEKDIQKKRKEEKSEDDGRGASKFTVRFEIRGSQGGVVNFLRQIEKMDRVLVLTRVEFEKEKAEIISKTIEVSGEAAGYYLPEKLGQVSGDGKTSNNEEVEMIDDRIVSNRKGP